jgi:pimeloyl-ACP methyl ester carboxylesterase
MKNATLASMPQELKTSFLRVTPDTARLRIMFNKDVERMRGFKDWSDAQIKSIGAPTLLINGDMDVITPEHAIEMHRLIAKSQLAILPGGHGKYMGEITTLPKNGKFFDFCTPLIEEFLNRDN